MEPPQLAYPLPAVSRKWVARYFLAVFITVGIVLTATISVFYQLETEDYLVRLKSEELSNLVVQDSLIVNSLADVVTDLEFLAKQNELQHLLDGGGRDAVDGMAREYLAFSGLKRKYDQIRFIDDTGMERVRVNFNDGVPEIVPDDRLQLKSNRYYFTDAIALDLGEVFVSPLDLNIEQGKIEMPFKPMMRFATPVFDAHGRKRGIFVLNYLGATVMDRIRAFSEGSLGDIMLVNADGFWLSSPRKDDEWGFMLPEKRNRTIAADFKEEWQRISTFKEVQINTPRGLFTSATIYPLKESARLTQPSGTSPGARPFEGVRGYPWKIISHIPAQRLNQATRGLLVKLSLLAVFLFLFAAIPSWFIAQALARRRQRQLDLYRSANSDKLTGLPNRALFGDRLSQTLSQARRYERRFALLFIDLDGFKSVNDTLGHDAGDDLLVQVAARLSGCLRQSDTVARLGGDEFTAILSTISAVVDAEMVAGKIVQFLASPFTLNGRQVQIGASIGISTYPENGQDADTLLKTADEVMYLAKEQGKNRYRRCVP